MTKLRVLDLFSGIGGFSLGLERTGGFETVAFCEIEPYPRAVLAKHWPGVPIYDDVRTLTADALRRDGIAVDVICGGFPCQDISFAGKRAGLEGERSGLWREYARLIGEIRPRYVLVENVPGLLTLGMGAVLGDLAALGYDATWDCIPAAAVGAPHRRDRVWLVGYARCEHSPDDARSVKGGRQASPARSVDAGDTGRGVPDALSDELRQQPGRSNGTGGASPAFARKHGQAQPVADADVITRHERWSGNAAKVARGRDADRGRIGTSIRNADLQGLEVGEGIGSNARTQFAPALGTDWWLSEPDVGRVAHGVPSRVDRLKGLGNAVVPQIPELIGRAILKAEGLAA